MNSKGYTLVEVLAVIVILGILAGIAVVSITGMIEKST
jgi:type IV pilus assembly protein PilA